MTMTILAYLPIFLLIIIISVFFHEIGHLIAYKSNGRKVEFCIVGTGGRFIKYEFSFTLFGTIFIFRPFSLSSSGIVLSSEFPELTAKEIRRVAYSGPVVNFILATLALIGLWYIFHDGIYNYERHLIFIIGAITTINFSLGIINLIPIKNEYGMMSDGAMAREAKNPYSKEDMSEMVNNAISNNIRNEQHKQMLQRLYL